MWDPKGKVSQDSLVFPTQGGRLMVILSIHSCVMGIRQEQRDQADSLQSRPSQGSSMINKGADHLFGPGTAGGRTRTGGWGGFAPGGRGGAPGAGNQGLGMGLARQVWRESAAARQAP